MNTILKLSSALCLLLLLVMSGKLSGQGWMPLGGNLANGAVANSDLVVDNNGTPYVAFIDVTNSSRVTVKKYDGSSWVVVGTPGISTAGAKFCKMAVNKFNKIFVVFDDSSLGRKAVVKKFDDTAWVQVGDSSFTGSNVLDIDIACDTTGRPVVAYIESATSLSGRAKVKRYFGGSWTLLGTPPANDLPSEAISIAIGKDNTTYIAYIKRGGGYIKVRSLPSWTDIGMLHGFFGASCSIATGADNKVYVATWTYKTFFDAAFPWVAVYDGANWQELLVHGFTSYPSITQTDIAVGSDNRPYLTYNQENSNEPPFSDSFYTRVYDGSEFPASDSIDLTAVYQTGAIVRESFISSNAGTIAAGYRTGNAIYVRQITGLPNGIAAPELIKPGVVVYPNPTTSQIFISLAKLPSVAGTVAVYDVTGKLVLLKKVTSQTLIMDIRDIHQGIYFIHYRDEEINETVKIIKH